MICTWFPYPFFAKQLFSWYGIKDSLDSAYDSLNTLFSGLAFCAIIYTIYLQQQVLYLQSQDLKLQKEELKATRIELKRSADAQASTEKSAQKQADLMLLTAKLNALNTLALAFRVKYKEAVVKNKNDQNNKSILDSSIYYENKIQKTFELLEQLEQS